MSESKIRRQLVTKTRELKTKKGFLNVFDNFDPTLASRIKRWKKSFVYSSTFIINKASYIMNISYIKIVLKVERDLSDIE